MTTDKDKDKRQEEGRVGKTADDDVVREAGKRIIEKDKEIFEEIEKIGDDAPKAVS